MGILDTQTTSKLGLGGTTPPKFGDTAAESKLHDSYSINGDPSITGKPSPSNLDLNGETPSKYLDTPPL